MLVIHRQPGRTPGQTFYLQTSDGLVAVHLTEYGRGQVRVAIDAPPSVRVSRDDHGAPGGPPPEGGAR